MQSLSQSRCVSRQLLSSGCRRQCRGSARMVCNAAVEPAARVPQQDKRSVLRTLSAAVELEGQVQRYENLAGRSAMVGVAAAALIELVTDHGVFSSGGTVVVTGEVLAFAAAAVVVLGGATAVVRNATQGLQDIGIDVLEAVYASLTAVKRSASGVTQTQVDSAVDSLLEGVLENRLSHFSIEHLLSSDDEHM